MTYTLGGGQKILLFAVTLAWLVSMLASAGCSSGVNEADTVKTIGVLQLIDKLDPMVDGLKQGLGELGYVEDQNVNFLYRNIHADTSLLDSYLKEMIEADVDVIVSVSDPPTMAAKTATDGTGIPVVFSVVSNPQETGLVASLSNPGGNLTGVMAGINLAAAKRLETLQRVDQGVKRVLLVYSSGKTSFPGIPEMLAAAPKLGIDLITAEVANADEAAKVYSDVQPGEIDAVFMPVDAPVVAATPALMELVKRDRIPIISPSGMRGNAVMSYGPDLKDMGVQMSAMVAKVLAGADPGTIPVELPRRQRLALYLGTAKEIGYEFSDEALSLADTLVEN